MLYARAGRGTWIIYIIVVVWSWRGRGDVMVMVMVVVRGDGGDAIVHDGGGQ